MKPSDDPYGEKIAHVEYSDIDFVWVSSHYDFHRDGICNYNGQLCRFSCGEESDDDWKTERIDCSIHVLTPAQRKRWLRRKRRFEICVGHHWSYPDRKKMDENFEGHYRQLPSGVWVQRRSWWQRILFCFYFLNSARSPLWWPRWLWWQWRNS